MSLSGDSCSTSSGCVSDLETDTPLSEDQLGGPDSPISDSLSDSLISSTNSVIKSLPNTEDEYHKELILNDSLILSTNWKVPDVAEQVDELLEEELIESEIVIDSSHVDCADGLSLNQVLTANCQELRYDSGADCGADSLVKEEPTDYYQSFNTSFDFSSSLYPKSGTSSIKSYTSQTSGHESDGTRQSSDSSGGSSGDRSGHNSSVKSERNLNGLFKEVNEFKCLSTPKSDDITSNCSKTSSKSSSSSDTNSNGCPHYCCKWTNCDWPGSKDDLVDHIREIHVELQPYQQQKHNWVDYQTKTKANNKSQTRRLADSVSNMSATTAGTSTAKKPESTHQTQQRYVCLWEGCKVYGKGSSSRNWLERHVLEQHSGPRPFKCIVEGCGQRFKLQSALERHVNSHFKPSAFDCSNGCSSSNCSSDMTNCTNNCCANGAADPTTVCPNSVHGLSPFELHLQQSSSFRATMSAVRCKCVDQCSNHHMFANGGTPNKILKRKKSNQKIRRKCFYVTKSSEDFFDECVMEQVRYGLIQLNAETGLDISGSQSTITFQSQVIARRENDSGEVNVLLKWEPNDILPDVWVPEDKVSELSSKTVPVSTLPANCLAQLVQRNHGFECKPKTKQRRK